MVNKLIEQISSRIEILREAMNERVAELQTLDPQLISGMARIQELNNFLSMLEAEKLKEKEEEENV